MLPLLLAGKIDLELDQKRSFIASQGIAAVFLPRFVTDYFNAQVKTSMALGEIKVPKVKTIIRDVFIIQRKNEEEGVLTKRLAKALRMLN